MGFERVDTKSPSEAVELLFSQAMPALPVMSMEDISRICRNDLKYDVPSGRRHVVGTADHLRPIIVWNLDKAPGQLHSGQRVVGYQVMFQPQLQFAALTLFIGDASGTPGYAFGARVWRTAEELFVQGWEGFETTPPGFPMRQEPTSLAAAVEVRAPLPSAAEPHVLSAELRDESWEIRAAAAELLGERRDLRSLEALVQILNDKNEDLTVKEAAAEALRKLGDARGLASVKEWEYSGRPVFMDFGPDDPDTKRRRKVAVQARARVQQARTTLERALSQRGASPVPQGTRKGQRPWWRYWR